MKRKLGELVVLKVFSEILQWICSVVSEKHSFKKKNLNRDYLDLLFMFISLTQAFSQVFFFHSLIIMAAFYIALSRTITCCFGVGD